jgi:hypothetical protein
MCYLSNEWVYFKLPYLMDMADSEPSLSLSPPLNMPPACLTCHWSLVAFGWNDPPQPRPPRTPVQSREPLHLPTLELRTEHRGFISSAIMMTLGPVAECKQPSMWPLATNRKPGRSARHSVPDAHTHTAHRLTEKKPRPVSGPEPGDISDLVSRAVPQHRQSTSQARMHPGASARREAATMGARGNGVHRSGIFWSGKVLRN